MRFKLNPDYFTGRIPLCIRRKNNTVYFQLQHETVGFSGCREGIFCEYDKITSNNILEIGLTAKKLLNRFHEISDFTLSELEEMLSENTSGFMLYSIYFLHTMYGRK